MKRIKYAVLMLSFVACVLAACGKNIDYDAEYDYVLEYLHDTYGGDYTIKKVDFYQYDYGITAGQFIYYFEVWDSQGVKFTAHYMRLTDLCENTVSSLTFDPV